MRGVDCEWLLQGRCKAVRQRGFVRALSPYSLARLLVIVDVGKTRPECQMDRRDNEISYCKRPVVRAVQRPADRARWNDGTCKPTHLTSTTRNHSADVDPLCRALPPVASRICRVTVGDKSFSFATFIQTSLLQDTRPQQKFALY